jgi:nucleoid-associated protein YgaU/DNA-binding SARP family transcriptional activator
VPLEAVAAAVWTGCWALWVWATASLVLGVLVRLAEALTRGAAWVGRVAAVVDRLSLPAARRVADRAVVAVIAVHLATRVPAATAAPLDGAPAAVLARAEAAPAAGARPEAGSPAPGPPGLTAAAAAPDPSAPSAAESAPPASTVTVYVVRPGDTLWAIAARHYGDGAQYPRIVAANAGRVMPTGERFTPGGVIRPGWPLEVPAPAPVACAEEPGGELVYTVVAGDSLSGIAERYLGDRECWRGLYALNRGVARLGDGRTLTDPDLIWPGLRLRLPRSAPVAERLAEAPAAGATEGPPVDPAGADPAPPAVEDGAPRQPQPPAPDHAPTPPSGAEAPGAGAQEEAVTGARGVPVTAVPEAPPRGESGAAPAQPPPRATAAGATPEPPAIGDGSAEARPQDPSPGPAVPAWRPELGAPADEGESAPVPAPALAPAAGLAALAGAAGALLLARRRLRRRLDDSPALAAPRQAPPPAEDLAEAAPARTLAGRLQEGQTEPAVRLAAHAHRFVEGRGLAGVALALVEQRHDAATLVWWGAGGAGEAGLPVAEPPVAEPPVAEPPVAEPPVAEPPVAELADLADAFAARVGGRGRGAPTPDGAVAWSLTGLKLATLLPAPRAGAEVPLLLPLGQAPGAATVYADWGTLGHVLVAGLPGGGGEAVLTSLVVALATQRRPEAVRLWGLGDGRSLPWLAAGLPHLAGTVRTDAEAAVAGLLERLRAATERRLLAVGPGRPWRATAEEPELVLVAGELADLPAGGTALEQLGTYGPSAGVRILAATTRLPGIEEGVLAHFATRIGLQAMDDAESVRLLGVPEAADLAGGELLVRTGWRTPLRLRGFRVPDERLEELGRLMRDATGDGEAGLRPDSGGGDAPPPGTPDTLPAATPPADDPAAATGAGPGAAPIPPPALGGDAPATVPAGAAGEAAENPDAGGAWTTPLPGGAGAPAPPAAPAARDVETVADRSATHAPAAGATGEGPAERPRPTEQDRRADPGPDAASVPDAPRPDAGGSATPGDGSAAAPAGAAGQGPPQLAIHCLGDYAVRSGARELVPTGEDGASYRPWEVLAYLAVYPGGIVPRERLLAALWPDVPPERATSALRAAMSRLRGLLGRQVAGLGADVVRAERDQTCRLDATVVWSDAQEFWSRCRAAPELPPEAAVAGLERAVALYGGDLLASRAARDYDWLDESGDDGVSLRRQYREEFYRALQRLARLHRTNGRPAAAVPLYKRLLQAEPIFEDIVRELYRCYRELGDLASLVREDRHLRQALRQAFADPDDSEDDPAAYEPEPETVALFRRIRADLEARAAVPPPALVEAAGDGGHGEA